MVAAYNPDYLLVLLGFNDIGWMVSDGQGTFESMKTFINEARSAKPNIKMALGNVPQRRFMDCREDLPIQTDIYNRLLESEIPQLSMYISTLLLSQSKFLPKHFTMFHCQGIVPTQSNSLIRSCSEVEVIEYNLD